MSEKILSPIKAQRWKKLLFLLLTVLVIFVVLEVVAHHSRSRLPELAASEVAPGRRLYRFKKLGQGI